VLVQALILAETGTPHLRPLTDHLPTSLVPVGGTPLLDHQIQALQSAGLSSVTVVGGYRGAQVEQVCRRYAGVRYRSNPRYERGEPSLEALRAAGLDARSPWLILRGDLIFDPALIEPLVASPDANRTTVAENGASIGLWHPSRETMEALVSLLATGDPAMEGPSSLYGFLTTFLHRRGLDEIPTRGRSWVCVDCMPALAGALRAHRDIAEAHVARTRAKLGVIHALRAPGAHPQPVRPHPLGSPALRALGH
jgi:hypothetical protein